MRNLDLSRLAGIFILVSLLLVSYGDISAQITISENFETWSPAQTTTSCTVGTLGAVGNGWTQDQTDGGEWRLDNGGTTSSSTGPSVDYYPGTSSGYYMYTESSSPCYGTTCNLVSPAVNLNAFNYQLDFAYHMYGSTMGSLSVDVWQDTAWVEAWTLAGDQGNQWNFASVNLAMYSGDSTFIRFRGLTGSNYYSDMAIDAVDLFPLLDDDLAVVGVHPSEICSGPTDFYAIVENAGGNTIYNYTLNWSIDNVAQTTITVTDSIEAGSMDTVFLSNFNFINSTYDIEIIGSSPNGVTDPNAYNDTLALMPFFLSLNGNYTVGATGDFLNFTEAVNALSTYGICGPVVFEVESGTYTEQLTLTEVPGISDVNTVTFKSATGVNTDVVLTYGITGSSDNWVIKLSGADYFTFQDISIKATSSSTSYGVVIDLSGGAHHNTFTGNYMEGISGTTSSNAAIVRNYNSFGDSANVFTYNEMKYGGYSMYMYASGYTAGNVISHNYIHDFQYYGIYLRYQEGIEVNYNTITSGQYSTHYGIYTYYVQGAFKFIGNQIHTEATSTNYGLRLYYCNGTPSTGLVANNFISQAVGTGTTYGFYVYYSSNVNIYNNSVNITAGSTSSTSNTACYVYQPSAGGYGNIRLVNNSFANTGGGSAIYIHDYAMSPGMVSYQDYNNYYSTSSTPIQFGLWNVTTIADLNLIEPHGLMVDPGYVSTSNLHSFSALLASAGKPLASVPFDIDMEPRDPAAPNIGADEFVLYDNNIGITDFQGIDAVCPGPIDVYALVQNYGLLEVNTATVDWSVNGVAQTAVTVTDTIPVGGAVSVFLGSYTFLSGTIYDVEAVSSMPNGVADQDPANDSIGVYGLQTAAAGAFTIGTGGDFATIADAYYFIDNYGVCGAVTFNILPGTYNEQVTIDEVFGVSAVNTVTWQSSTGNRTDVVVQFSANGSSDNWVWKFNNADYHTVKDITIKSTYPTGSTIYGRVLHFDNGSNYNTIDNCILHGVEGTSTSDYYAVVYSYSNAKDDHITIKNSDILYGSYAVRFYASSSNPENNNKFLNNHVEGYYYYGIYCYYNPNVWMNGNTILQNPNGYTYNYPLYAYYCDSAIQVKSNYIYDDAGSYFYGLRVYYCDGTQNAKGLIANNMVAVNGPSSTNYGLYIYNSLHQDIYNNSVQISTGSTVYAGYLYMSSTSYGPYNFVNNNMVNLSTGGYCLYGTSSGLSQLTSSNNNLYSNSSNLCYFSSGYPDLAAWNAAGFVNDVLNTTGGYLSGSDLHSNSIDLDGAGLPLAEVPTDIDGEYRDPVTPDVGADEFTLANDDAAITGLPGISALCPGTADIWVTLSNYGLVEMTSAVINWEVNGVAQTSYSYTDTIPVGGSADVLIGTYDLLASNSYDFVVWSSLPNGNVDPNSGNDTLVVNNITTATSGNFTIGATGDFQTFGAAVNYIDSLGICGPVVFTVDSGLYTEQVTIPEIMGSSATNTITFTSATGNAADVQVTWSPSGTGDNWVWRFGGVDYCSLENMTIKSTYPSGSTVYGRVIEMFGGSSYNMISGCVLEGVSATTTSNYNSVVYDYYSGGNNSYNTFMDNEILNGSYSMYNYASSGSPVYGNKYINNNFLDYYYYGIRCYYFYNVEVNGNTILQDPIAGYNYNYPAYIYYADGASKVINNYIYDDAGSYFYGLRVGYADANADGNMLIANNMIATEGLTSTQYGLYVYNGINNQIYNNSVSLMDGGTNYTCYLYMSSSTYGPYDFKNNSIVNHGTGGYCLYGYSSTSGGTLNSSYNNLYTNSSTFSNIGGTSSNWAAWNSSHPLDMVNTTADYLSPSDLHTFSPDLNQAGTPVPEVMFDIDGDPRDPFAPDIGADEFDLLLPANELAARIVYTLGQLPQGAADNHEVEAIVKNQGGQTQYNVPVTLSITGANTFTDVFTIDSIMSGQTMNILFAPYTAANLGIEDVTVSLPNDLDNTNNTASYLQVVTTDTMTYADTSAIVDSEGHGTAEGMILAKYYINGTKVVSSVGAFVTDNNALGAQLHGVVLDTAGNILSESDPIVIDTVNVIYNFPILDPSATTTINGEVYVGIYQHWGSAGYYPIGVQEEDPLRPDAFFLGDINATTITPTGVGRLAIGATVTDPDPNDLACIAIMEPYDGCGLGIEPVTIKVQNFGSSTVTTFEASFQLNSNNAYTEIVTANIPSGGTYDYTFVQGVDLTVLADSTFDLMAWVDLTGDLNQNNDTAWKVIESMYQPAPPTANNTTILYGSMAELSVTTNDPVEWFETPAMLNSVGTNDTLTIGPLYDTVSYWAVASTSSQAVVQIGTGTSTTSATTYPNPYCTWYYGNREQLLVRAEELISMGITAGIINSISFNSMATATMACTNFEMKIGHTNDAVLSNWQTGLTSVYFNPSFTPPVGWNEHLFSTPFEWDGVSNIIVETCFNNTSYTSGGSIEYTVTPFNSCLVYRADNSTVCSSTSVSYNNGNRPNMRFDMYVPGCATDPVEVTAFVANIPQNDIGVIAANSPMSGTNLTNAEALSVEIQNWGNNDALVFPISYDVTGALAASGTEMVTTPLMSGTTMTYNFSSLLDLSAYGTYNICVYTQLNGDGFLSNDTLCFTVDNDPPVFCSSGANSTNNQEIVQVDLSNMSNYSFPNGSMYSNYNLSVNPAALTLGNNHPISITSDFAPGFTSQNNCWVEVYVDWDNDGVYTEPTEIAYSSAITSSQTVNGMISVPLTASLGMHSMRVVLEQTTSAIGVTPCGYYNYGETEDYQVFIQPPYDTDAGAISILSPNGVMLENSSQPVEVVVYNFGNNDITAMDVVYTVNGVAGGVYPYTGLIPAFSADTISIGNVTVPGGYFDICAYTILANDSSAMNDTTCISLFADPQYDLEMLEITTPLGGCALGLEDVTVVFHNIGDTIFGNLPLSYWDSTMTAPVTEVFNNTVLPGDTVTYTFTTQIDLTVTQFTEFYLYAYTDYAGDPLHINDTTMFMFTSDISPAAPSADDIVVWAGTFGTLAVNNPDTGLMYEWFDVNNVSIGEDTIFETPVLFDTTTYYVQASTSSYEEAELMTTFAAGNGSAGNMFDITAFEDITIDSFYVHPQSSGTMEVWYKPGTYLGFTANQSAWTQLGTGNVTSMGTGNPSLLLVGGLEIPAGQTYGIYITMTSGSVSYTNGNGSNQIYQDDNIKIECGHGGSYFNLTFTPRVWNGTVHYTAGAPGCGSALTPVTAFVDYADYDAAITAITSPVSASNMNNVAVSCDVYNNGLLPLFNIPIQYVVNGGAPVTATIAGPINPGDTYNFEFADSINAFVFGTYNLCISTMLAADGYTLNDEMCTDFSNWDGNGESCSTAFPYLLVNEPPVYQTTVHPYDRHWWRFELPVSASDVYVSLCGSSFDTKLEVYSDCPPVGFGASAYMSYNDNSCGQQSEIHFNAMSAGTYWARVYGGGMDFGDYVLEITGIPDNIFDVTFTETNVTCNGYANGECVVDIQPIVPGATLPFTYEWSDPAITGLNLTGLAPGTYTITITDFTGISQVESFDITEPTAMSLSLAATDCSNLGSNDGTLDATISGGTPGYQYDWNSGHMTEDIAAAYAGVYTVTVTDTLGCTIEQTITVHSPRPGDWDVIPTANTHLIIVDENSDVTLDGIDAAYGSLIGVWYNQGGTMVCGGWGYWSGFGLAITAYGQTVGQDNGFEVGENYTWKLYEAALNVEYGGSACYIQPPTYPNTGTFALGGFSGIDCLDAQSIILHPITLPLGWSIWSTYVDPVDPNMAAIMDSIVMPPYQMGGSVEIVKSGTGLIYWPFYGLNTIGNIVYDEGYQIKMNTAEVLHVEGLLIDPILQPLTIPSGWSIIAYLRTSPMNIADIMSSITMPLYTPGGSVEIVKSGTGLIYWPFYGLNTIGNMLPGQGYQIKMNVAETLYYPANTAAPSKSNVIYLQTQEYTGVENTGSNMSLGILEDAWDVAPNVGDEIGVFNANGDLIGSTVYEDGFSAITVWGDDSQTKESIENISEGEIFTIKIWNNSENTEREIRVESWLEGNDQYANNAIAVVEKLTVLSTDNDGYALYQNVPNPFKDITEISFYLPETSKVTLVVYNALGEKVEELVSANFESGRHSVTFEKASLPSGTYFYKIVADDFTATKAMNINR